MNKKKKWLGAVGVVVLLVIYLVLQILDKFGGLANICLIFGALLLMDVMWSDLFTGKKTKRLSIDTIVLGIIVWALLLVGVALLKSGNGFVQNRFRQFFGWAGGQ